VNVALMRRFPLSEADFYASAKDCLAVVQDDFEDSLKISEPQAV
jgi:hypothetical protein